MSISRRDLVKGLGAIAVAGSAGAARPASASGVAAYPGYAERVGLLHDTTLCVGCRSCELACTQVNGQPPPAAPVGDQAVFEHERRVTRDALTVVNRYRRQDGRTPAVYRKQQCMHCNEPCCVSVCLVSAFEKTPEGPVVYHPERCMGCRYCMTACPYLALAYEYDDPLTPSVKRCTMCYDRIKEGRIPGCAEACPTGAITFGRREDLLALARQRLREHPERYVDHVFGEHEFGGTSWLVLAGVDFSELGLPDHPSHTPIPEMTKGFLSVVPLVLTMWPGLLGGFYFFTRRKETLHRQRLRREVEEARREERERADARLADAAKAAAASRKRAVDSAVEKALAEAARDGGTE